MLFKMKDMKTTYLICLLLLFSEMAVAQDPDTMPVKHLPLKETRQTILWYVHGPNLSYANFYLLPSLGFALLNKKHGGVIIEMKKGIRHADNVPDDFEPSNFLNGNGRPKESTMLVLLSYVREFGITSPNLIPTVQMGLSYSEREYPDNFVYLPPTGGWFDCSDNYSYDIKKTKAMGLYLKPGIKYLFTKNIAVSVAPWTVLQERNSYYGIELGFQFGKLR